MKTLSLITASLLTAAVSLTACEEKKEPVPSSAGAAAPSAAPVAAAPPVAKAAGGDETATEEDFEDEAEKEITESSLQAELEKLEKELR